MPAYRSQAEADIRDAVVARIRERRPQARIIHEINVSTYGPNRIDLIAVDRAEIIAVEIKSEKDKLDRLPAQMTAMKAVAHHGVAALHEKFLVEQVTNQWSAHCERDGAFYMRTLPDGLKYSDSAWVYPERRRAMPGADHDHLASWRFPPQNLDTALPWDALDLLWRAELYELCGALRISANSRSTMTDMSRQLRWLCTGRELTRGICALLRARRCIEADPAIEGERIAA
ncbi:NERD domain-containing protein [Mesorhizobium sp. KR9-304]|uniref:NERD domain-containing protein n=1 Tax=Mesorhizobium sp. KR9-304 TaxID=3156614 RepID=UPI0032B34C57